MAVTPPFGTQESAFTVLGYLRGLGFLFVLFFYVAKSLKALYGCIVANRERHQTEFLIVSFHSGQGS